MTDVLLQVRGLHAQYGNTRVLHGIDFDVTQGGITTILGANGAGKTTTLRAVCGMVKTQGEILLAGERIQGAATENIVRQGVAHVPDGRGTFLNFTVEENLRIGAYTRKDKAQVLQDYERIFGYFPMLKARRKQQAGARWTGHEHHQPARAACLARNESRLFAKADPENRFAPFRIVL